MSLGIGIGIPFIVSIGTGSGTIIVSDGLIWYRKLIRDEVYVIDYSADGGTTWELGIVEMPPDEDSIVIWIDDGEVGYRHLVRDGEYVIDHVLTPTGFAGVRDTDWENVYSTAVLSFEDLSLYTEEDDDGYLTVAGTKVTATSLLREALTHLTKDFGADYFGNFEIHFKLYVDSTDNDNQAYLGCVLASNDASGGFREITNGSGTHVTLKGEATFDLHVGDEAVAYSHYAFNFNTVYYVKFTRNGAINKIDVYSDEAMTSLVISVPRTDGTIGTSYRYLHIATSYHYGGSFAGAKASGYIDNVKIISH